MMWFAKDLKEPGLINQGRIAIRNMDFEVFVAAAVLTLIVGIKSDFAEFVMKFAVDRVVLLKCYGVFFTNHSKEYGFLTVQPIGLLN